MNKMEATNKFPCCGRLLTLEMPASAMAVRSRTCPQCKTRWQIIIKPLPSPGAGMRLHEWDWLQLGETQ